jgi:energy-converting hydrogenase Eha subunit F
MINLEARTKLKQEEVIERLKNYFGKGGLGLEITEEASQYLTFEGGGGYVTATLCPEEGKVRINMVSREWDFQVKKFASSLP